MCRPASADFFSSGYQPNPPLQRDASPASRLRAPELEEARDSQVIEMTYQNTSKIETRYRIEGNHIRPLFYKTDGGVGLAMLLSPVFVFCLWLGLVAAWRATRRVSTALKAVRNGAINQPPA